MKPAAKLRNESCKLITPCRKDGALRLPLYWMFDSGSIATAQAAMIIGFAISGIMFGLVLIEMSQLFPAGQ